MTHDNRILDIADRILSLEDGYMEESNLALDRLSSDLTGLAEHLRLYPERFRSPAELASVADVFCDRLNAIVPRLADMVSRRQPAVSGSAVATMVGNGRGPPIPRRVPAPNSKRAGKLRIPDGTDELCDAAVQSLDFLLHTAASAMRMRVMRDAEILTTLTSNHSNAQQSIRTRFEEMHSGASQEFRNSRLELITLYFRCVYFLHHIAGRLVEDITALPVLPPEHV